MLETLYVDMHGLKKGYQPRTNLVKDRKGYLQSLK
jgi:hypothetical protein